MKMATLADARERLPELLRQAQEEMIGLTDEEGNVVGLLAGVTDDCLDELLVRTPGFREMIARSRASLQREPPVSADDLYAEAMAELAEEERSGRGEKGRP
jgi:hypothetical protein